MDHFKEVPRKFIPPKNSDESIVLFALIECQCSTKKLTQLLGKDPRSALQRLRNADYGYWKILNTSRRGGNYRLDPRHLSGDSTLDDQARNERRIELLLIQKDNDLHAVKRQPRSTERWKDAQEKKVNQLELSLLETKQPA
jgi:hypothetical protein